MQQPPSSPDPLRDFIDRAREFLRPAGVYLRRGWEAVAHAAREVWAWLADAARRTQPVLARVGGRVWPALVAAWAAIAAWFAARRRARSERPRRRGAVSSDAAIVVARAEDDTATITGRIDTAEDLEVILVVPRAARRLRQATAWPHIAAHARRRGIVLRVVSARSDVRAHARANGLRSARRLRSLQRDGLRIPFTDLRLRLPGLPVGGLFRLAVVLGVIALLGWLVLYQVPSATITIVPNAEPYTASREVRLSPVVDASSIETDVVSARTAREEVTTLIAVETTGEAPVGEEFAAVTLQFTNEGDDAVIVPQGALVSDAGGLVTFRTTVDLELEPGEAGQVDAAAAQPGTVANVDADVLVVVDNLPGVVVTNPEAASGGSDRMARAVSEDDLARAAGIADDVLRVIAERSLQDLLGEDTVLFPETLSTAIFSQTPLQQQDEPAEVLLVEYVIVVQAMVLDPTTANVFGEQMIRAELGPSLALLPGTTETIVLDDASVDAGQVHVTLQATGEVASIEGLDELAELVTGMRPAEAELLIAERLRLAAPPRIEINPTFIPWRWLPRSADDIDVVLSGLDLDDDDEDEDEEADEDEDEADAEEPSPQARTAGTGG